MIEILRSAWTGQHFPNRAIVVAALIAVGAFSITWFNQDGEANPHSAVIQPAPAGPPRFAESFGKLPLSFERNVGQADASVSFLSRGPAYAVFLTGNKAVLSLEASGGEVTKTGSTVRPGRPDLPALAGLRESHRERPTVASRKSSRRPAPTAVHMSLAGANPAATVSGVEELPEKRNYLIGNDPTKWRTNVPTYAKVKYQSVYPGIDLVYYGNPQNLEYDFLVAPGADPSAIAFTFSAPSPSAGELPLHVDANGDLVMEAGEYEMRLHKPVVYQTGEDSAKHFVDGKYILTSDGQVTFSLAAYDRGKLLVIDPVLSYSTYLGGSSLETSTTSSGIVAVDASGHAHVTGLTMSTDFPTVSPLQGELGGGSRVDAYVAKLTPDGSALIYATYLGGSGLEFGLGIAVDASGHAYVTGVTASNDFPTARPLQAVRGGPSDAFVAKLTPDGSALVYSTYLGGSKDDKGFGIGIDATGSAYVTGLTASIDFPTSNPLQAAYGGGLYDAFVAKLTGDGSALAYSTYIGGGGSDGGGGIAVDTAGSAYVTGDTDSTNFPTASPLQAYGGNTDAFVAKLTQDGSAFVYATYLGGTSRDSGEGIAVDGAGHIYVSGITSSTDFPTASPLQAYGGNTDAFVAKLAQDGSAFVYATYLGGTSSDNGYGIAIDASDNAYVSGITSSADFPTANPLQAVLSGGADAFVAKIGIETTPIVDYEIVSRNSGKCLDVFGASTEAGASAIQWVCHGGPNQQWRLEPAGGGAFHIIARHSGQALDIFGASLDDVTPIIQWPPHGGDNQVWTLEPASNGYVSIVARHSGKALDVEYASTEDGARVIQYTPHGGANQQWLLRAVGSAAAPITTVSDREP
jgi:hypothetical protein